MVLTSQAAPVVLSSELDVGELWTVRVTPNDGWVDGIIRKQVLQSLI